MEEPVDPGVVEFWSEELLPDELVLFDLSFLSLDELDEPEEFMLPLGEVELGFVVSEGMLLPGVDGVPDVDDEPVELGDDVLDGEEVPAPGVPGEVV